MKRLKIIYVTLFIGILFLFGVWVLAAKNRSFSDMENRTLKTRQEISSDFSGGDFQADLELCLADQFPLRDAAVRLQTDVRYWMGQRDIGGAYLCSGGRLVQKITDADVDLAHLKKDAGRYGRLQNTGVPVCLIPVPSAGAELRSQLPDGAAMYDLDRVYAAISGQKGDAALLDLRPAMRECGADYYRTDHHWTTRGSYEAYALWRQAHGQDVPAFEDLNPQTAAEDFRGSLYAKAPASCVKGEPIVLIEAPPRLTVEADGQTISLYDLDALSQRDKYRVFLSGNHGLVTIENPDASGGTLLLVKDSFANCLVPFLARDYRRILLVDERYAAVSLMELAQSEQVDEIAVVKEACSF